MQAAWPQSYSTIVEPTTTAFRRQARAHRRGWARDIVGAMKQSQSRPWLPAPWPRWAWLEWSNGAADTHALVQTFHVQFNGNHYPGGLPKSIDGCLDQAFHMKGNPGAGLKHRISKLGAGDTAIRYPGYLTVEALQKHNPDKLPGWTKRFPAVFKALAACAH